MDTQSTLCAAGTTPRVLIRPLEGLRPTILFSARRHAAGAGRVGAQRKVDLAGGDHVGRAGAGAARHIRAGRSVGHGAVGRPRAVQAAGELVEVGLAGQRRTSRRAAAAPRRRGVRAVGKGRASRRGRHAGDVDVVLGGECQSGETHRSRCPPGGDRAWRSMPRPPAQPAGQAGLAGNLRGSRLAPSLSIQACIQAKMQ